MAHGNTVADTDDSEFKRYSSSRRDPFPDFSDESPEVGMTGDNVVPGIGHPDKRSIELLLGDPQRPEQRPVRGTVIPFLHFITSHG